MANSKKFRASHAALIVCLLLAACAGRPELVTRSATVPAGTDFSGNWQLEIVPGENNRPHEPAEQGIRIPPQGSRRTPESRPAPRSSGNAVSMFFETGKSLKISQTDESLFISFDRAIVEEYTFGENRMVSIGPIEARRVSGWQNDAFLVETLDGEGALLAEAWRLKEGGTVLLRDISVTQGNREKWSLRQRFHRN